MEKKPKMTLEQVMVIVESEIAQQLRIKNSAKITIEVNVNQGGIGQSKVGIEKILR